MRRIGLSVLVIAAALLALLAPSRALAAGPAVTLTDPANGALLTTGQPTFSGTAVDSPTASGTVTVNIYSGTSTGSSPVQVINTTASNGTYSAKAIGLPDGTYTADATEMDSSGNTGTSPAVTFQLFNGSPQLTLSAPPPPITTPQPVLTGTAKTDSGDSTTVQVIIYPGNSTDATPLAVLNGTIGSDGSFSVTVTPGLSNGTYTAVASQQLALTTTFSPSVQFTVAASTAGLSVTSPKANASEPQTGLLFTGSAGSNYGDAGQVNLSLYAGTDTEANPLGTATATVTNSAWSEQWPTTLGLGTYTLVVTQATATGQNTVTRTFRVSAPGSVTGQIAISKAGRVTATLSCLAGAGTCKGDVLIVTKTPMQTVYGGPLGPLRLMFARYSVAAAKSVRLTAQLSSQQLAALRRAGATRLVVTVVYPVGTKLIETARTTAAVKVGAAT